MSQATKIIALCSYVLFSCNAIAQQRINRLYIEAGLGSGNVFSVKGGLNYVFQETNVLSITFYGNYKTSSNAPADYSAGMFDIFRKPKDIMVTGSLMTGKILYSHSRDIRYNLKGGIALGNITYLSNFRRSAGWFSANYDYDQYTKNIAGITLNPTIEFPLSRAFGFSFGLFSIITYEISSFGIEGNILLGKVRNKKGF